MRLSLVLCTDLWLTAGVADPSPKVTVKDLRHWKLLKNFRQRVLDVVAQQGSHVSWEDERREPTALADYLSLFLLALLHPTVRTVRAIDQASRLARVQSEICGTRWSRTSFSDAQSLVEPSLLEKVFRQIAAEVQGPPPKDPQSAVWEWIAQDGSLWRALPRMDWAIYGAGRPSQSGKPSHAVRLHLGFHLLDDKPVEATITPGATCERAVWREQWKEGAAYVGDRYFGEDHQIYAELSAHGCHYVLRLREQATINVEEELPVSAEDRAAGVVRQVWATLGTPKHRSGRVRVVWVEVTDYALILVSNLTVEQATGEHLSWVYRQRWQVELFFKWVKCVLGCEHWLAESREGATIQLYLALIAGLLLQQAIGCRPTKRMLELLRLHLDGWATSEEFEAGLARELADLARKKRR